MTVPDVGNAPSPSKNTGAGEIAQRKLLNLGHSGPAPAGTLPVFHHVLLMSESKYIPRRRFWPYHSIHLLCDLHKRLKLSELQSSQLQNDGNNYTQLSECANSDAARHTVRDDHTFVNQSSSEVETR